MKSPKPLSSNTYSACLKPDPWLRILVVTSGRCLAAAGLLLILTLDLAALLRAVASFAWLIVLRFEIERVRLGFRAIVAIRVSTGGEVAVLNTDQEWVPCVLLTGSMVLQNLAWLRLKTATGHTVVDLLRGDARRCNEWRRLQVIWRHIGARS